MNLKGKFQSNNFFYCLLILWAIFQVIQLDGEWAMMDGDDAQYISHALSLIEHHRYEDPNFIENPENIYCSKGGPLGWPLLLVPIVFLFGKNLLVFKVFVILFAMGSGILLLKILELRTNDYWLSFLITAIYYFSMTTIVYSRIVYTEWPYMFFSFIVLYLLLGVKWRIENKRRLILTGVCIGFSLLFRAVAISLVLAVIAVVVQNKIIVERKIWVGIRWIGLILFTTIVIYQTVHFVVQPEEGGGYKEQFLSKNLFFQEEGKASLGDVISRIPENGRHFVRKIEPLFLGRCWHEVIEYTSPNTAKFINPLLYLLGAFISFFIVVGFILEVRRKPSVIEYYTLFYLVIMSIIWFHYEVYRYLMPITSFLIFYFSVGILFVVERVVKNAKKAKSVLYGFLTFILFVNVCHAGIEIYRYKFSSMSAKTTFSPYKATVEWLKENVKSNEVIIADDPRWYALETELPATMFPTSKDYKKVYNYITKFPGSVIVFDHKRRWSKVCLLPVLEKYCDRFVLLKEIGHIKIYGWKRN